MDAFALPPAVRAAVTARWPGIASAWVDAVPAELDELCARYHARPVDLLPSRFGYVVGVHGEGRDLIMRASPDPDGPTQARVGAALAGLGAAPGQHEVWETATGTWTVSERIVPGAPLPKGPPTPELLASLVSLFGSMAGRRQAIPGTVLVAEWLQARLELGDELTELAPGRRPAPESVRAGALSVLRDLNNSVYPDGICHGDTSSANVLTGETGRLWLVDPRGVTGEVAYDVAVTSLKTSPEPEAMARDLANAIGLETERVLAWLLVADAARV